MFSSVETPAKLGSTPQQGFCQQTLIIISITVNDNLSWWSSNHYHHHQFKWGLLFIIFIIISSLFVIVIIICDLFMLKKKCFTFFKGFPVNSQFSPCNKSYIGQILKHLMINELLQNFKRTAELPFQSQTCFVISNQLLTGYLKQSGC